MPTITEFQGDHRFLSNFWPAEVKLDGVTYPTVENAYQAAKTTDIAARKKFQTCTPGQAKRFGKFLNMRPDWDAVKLTEMEKLVRQKFEHEHLRTLLVNTAHNQLEEGNKWGDTYWGVCGGKGLNHLGKILMSVRGTT